MLKLTQRGRWKKRSARMTGSHLTEDGLIERDASGESRSSFGHWFWAFLILAVLCLTVLAQTFRERQAALAGLTTAEGAVKQLQKENEQLREEIDALRNDPKVIERIAREELNMLRRDELVFSFSNENDNGTDDGNGASSPPNQSRK